MYLINQALETPEVALRLDEAVLRGKNSPKKKKKSKLNLFICHMANNIGRVREVTVRAARTGWRGGRSCGRRDKGHLCERPKACSREHRCYPMCGIHL